MFFKYFFFFFFINDRFLFFFFFSSRRRHTRSLCDWSSDVCSSDLTRLAPDMYGAHMKFNLHFLHAAERVTPGGRRRSRARGERINSAHPLMPDPIASPCDKAETEPPQARRASGPHPFGAPRSLNGPQEPQGRR